MLRSTGYLTGKQNIIVWYNCEFQDICFKVLQTSFPKPANINIVKLIINEIFQFEQKSETESEVSETGSMNKEDPIE